MTNKLPVGGTDTAPQEATNFRVLILPHPLNFANREIDPESVRLEKAHNLWYPAEAPGELGTLTGIAKGENATGIQAPPAGATHDAVPLTL